MKKFSLLILSLLFSNFSWAEMSKVTSDRIAPPSVKGRVNRNIREIKTFENPQYNPKDCDKNPIACLKRVRFKILDSAIRFTGEKGDVSFGSRLFGFYETEKISDIEKFGFVGYVKGCIYERYKEGNQLRFLEARLFGQTQQLNFSDYVLDTSDMDPMYGSGEEIPNLRHATYKWNPNPYSTNRNFEKKYAVEKPHHPVAYISYIPGRTVFYDESTGYDKNISLKIKLCLHLEKDIPKVMTGPDMIVENPIACFNFDSSWIFNKDRMTFESPDKISPVCRQ